MRTTAPPEKMPRNKPVPPPAPLSDLGPKHIDLVIYPGFKALEAIGPLSVFEYANFHLARSGRPAGYQLTLVSVAPGTVRSDTHMSLEAARGLTTDNLPHTAIIVGNRRIQEALQANPAIVQWVSQVEPRIERLVSLCSGCFFLAAAGVLNGKKATTHWELSGLLASMFPAVTVLPDAIYVREKKLWTSAGVTAGIDLALALVEEDFGRGLALTVARDLVVYLKRPGGQSQFSTHLSVQSTSHPGIREVQDWVLSHLTEPLDLPQMALRAAMSERNFRRVFLKETGVSPARFVETCRLEAARRLLEEGDLPLKSIAAKVGLASEQALRQLFVRNLNLAPAEYRKRFGGTLHDQL